MSFRQFCEANQALRKTSGYCTTMQAMMDYEKECPDVALKYFDLRYEDYKV
jgi:hypothetical protein